MRKLLFAAAIALSAGSAVAQDNDKIEMSGNIVTRDVSINSFDVLKASGVYELKLSQGDKESVRIEADENLQQYFTVRNDGNKLIIDMDKIKNKSFRNTNKIRVYITFKKIKEMELNTVGNVLSEEQLAFDDLGMKNSSVGNVELELTVNKLDLVNKSVGNIVLKGKAQDAVVKNNGVGSLEAGSFVVQTMDIENTGVGGAEVNAEKDLKVTDSFLGKVKNKGAAQMRKKNKVRV